MSVRFCPWNAALICRHPRPTGEMQESICFIETEKVCRSSPHNLIPSTHFIEDVISGSAGESRSSAGKIQIQAVCAGCLFARHESHKQRKLVHLSLKSDSALPEK